MRSIPNIDEYIHRPTANHSFFAGFIRGEREVMQGRLSRSQCFARFGPHFSFDAAAADGACGLAILEEEHLGAASLWRRAARVGNGSDDDTLAALVRFANQTIEIVLSDGAHGLGAYRLDWIPSATTNSIQGIAHNQIQSLC